MSTRKFETDRLYWLNPSEQELTDVLKPYAFNREVPALHISALAKGIANNWRNMTPAIADVNTGIIVDGNCRFNAALMLAREGNSNFRFPVIFKDIPSNKIDDYVITLNSSSRQWKTDDYLNSYAERGIESFKKFLEFCISTPSLHKTAKDGSVKPIPRYASAALRVGKSQLRDKNWLLTDEQVSFAKRITNEAVQIRRTLSIEKNVKESSWSYEQFLRAWSEFKSTERGANINPDRFMSGFKSGRKYLNIPYGSVKKNEWMNFFRAVAYGLEK